MSDGSGRCIKHPRPVWIKTTPVKRITGRRLQAMRARLFASNPLCAACLLEGWAVAATQRDHIVPLEEGGRDDDSNEQGLCEACHDTKSKSEALRGRLRKM